MGLTKAQLEALNVASFPNNNEGLITPQILRDYNSASIANTVNQDTYTTDSASFDSRINALDPSGSVASFTALNAFTASQLTINTGYNTFTQSADGRLDNLEATTSSLNSSITQLNANTASQQSSINQLNTNSASVNSSISQLNASSASQQTSINNLNSFTASQSSTNSGFTNSINALNTSASLAVVTASVAGQTLTFTKGDTSTFSVTLPTGSGGGTTDITALNAFTASQLTINAGYNTTTASLNSSVSQLNANTASQQAQINSLISATASYANSASVAAVDAAQQSQINALIASTASADNTSLNAFTASQLTINSGYNTFTQSANQRLTAIESVSGSWITESETGSFARYNVSNPWSADQTFTNISAVSASFQYVQTIFETASVIYSSGSNQFGDAANDVQTLYGSVRVMNALTASGLNYPTADNGAESFIQTDGAGNLSLQYVKTIYQNIRNMEAVTINKGTPLFVSGSTGDNANVYIADASNPLRMPATLIAGDNTLAAGATGKGIIFGHIDGVNTTGYPAGTEVYVGVGGGWTSTRPTGSATPVQPLGVVTREGVNGMGIVLTQVPFDLPNIQTGYVWVGNGSNQPLAVATSSLQTNVSGYTTTASFNAYTSSTNSRLNNIETTTASLLIETQNLELFSASALSSISQLNASSASQQISINNLNTTTASLLIETQNLELFSASALTSLSQLNQFSASQLTKDATLQTYTASVNSSLTNLNTFTSSANQRLTAIESVSGSWITESETSSFARTNANNTFTGVNSFGQVSFTGSAPTIVSQSFSGSLITNLTDIYTDIPAVQQIVTLSSASYAALLSGSLTNPNTLYIVSGSISGSGGGGTTDITSLNAFTASQQLLNSTFATTGSNTFVGQQTIQNNLVIEEAGNPLIYTQITQDTLTNKLQVSQAGASGVNFNVNVSMQELTASLQQGYVWVGGTGNVSKLVATSSFIDTPINTGSFAITGSNIFYGDQIISGSSSMSYGLDVTNGIKADYFYTDGQGVFTPTLYGETVGLGKLQIEALGGVNIRGHFTASLEEGYVWVGDSLNKTKLVATSSFGTTINTGSFATTGSNTFIGNQIISGTFVQSGSNNIVVAPYGTGIGTWIQNRVLISGPSTGETPRLFISGSDGAYSEYGRGFQSLDTTKVPQLGASIFTAANIGNGANNTVAVYTPDTYADDVEIQMFANSSSVGFADWDNGTTFNYVPFMTLTPNVGDNPAPQFKRSVGITGSLDLSSTLTASLQQGYVWVGNASGRTTTVATSSFGGGGTLPAGLLSSSVTNFTDYSQSVDTRINNIVTGTGFATTGSNTFTGLQTIQDNPLNVLGQFPSVNLGLNQEGSGSQYPFVNIVMDTNGFSGSGGSLGAFNVRDDSTSQNLGLGINTYSSIYGSNNAVPMIFGQGNAFPIGDDSLIGFPAGRIDLWRNTNVSGSLNITGSLTASLQQGYVWVGNANGKTTTVPTSSFGGGGSINTGSFAITGSNTFIGGQQVVGPIQASDTNLGPQWVPGVAFQGVGSSSVAYDQFVNGGNYDAIHIQSNLGAGTDFQDLRSDTFGLVTWLNIPTNTGNNPAPQFKRGMGITGSVSVSGSVTFRGNTTFTSVGGNSTNIILGANALANATTANNSVAIGEGALNKNTTGNNNFALGSNAMYENTTGYQNVAMGVGALYNNTTGFLNVAIGNDAMISCGTASFQNIAIGNNALKTAIGNNNFGLGASALENNTGNANIALGSEAGKFASGSSNVLVGQRAGQYLTGSANTILGGYESTAGQVINNNIVIADGVGNVKAQYSGSAWSLQGEIKLNKGSNKPCDIVSVGSGGLTVSNSLVTGASIILLTTQNSSVAGNDYPAVVSTKGTGTFTIEHSYGGNLDVAYLIINPTA